MTPEPRPNQLLGIILGLLLLLGGHIAAIIFFFLLGVLVSVAGGGYAGIAIWAVGALFLFLWQLFYVIPLVWWLRRRRNWGLLKGVLMGAVLTGLVNGTCYLMFWR